MSTLTADRPAASPWRRAAIVLLATLLLHAWVLDRLDRTLAGTEAEPGATLPRVTARLLPPPAPTPAIERASAPPTKPAPPSEPRRRPIGKPPPQVVAEAPVRPETPPPAAAGATVASSAAVTDEPEPAAAPGLSENAERPLEPSAVEPPVFEATGELLQFALANLPAMREAMPAKARYVYRSTNSEIRIAAGTTVVDWTLVEDGRYELRLATRAVGITVLELLSEGRLSDFGLAPDRYTETRARRAPESANFDWPGRRITFSARPHERPLPDGMQDRVSFQIQLMLLGQAQPRLFRPGALLVMWMAGRDDVAEYRFRSAGRDATVTGIGELETVRLERVVVRETDARIEVWLAPALGWLPVRLRFTDRLGRVTESVLDSVPAS
jgi:outer membrane biosynthesis protein TonB